MNQKPRRKPSKPWTLPTPTRRTSGNRKVRYEDDEFDRENRQQDMFLLLAEAMAAMASDKTKAEFYRKRLERGMEWDKNEKRWKWKDEDEPAK